MKLMQTVLAFLIALGALVTIHELGHYIAARLCDVKILKFSVGLGKVIYSRKFGVDKTEWAISILPLGGYVKMLDIRDKENTTISSEDLSREFCQKSVWKRILIVIAGPLANFIVAVIIFSCLNFNGISEPIPKIRVPSETSMAYQSGLRHGDEIIAINDESIQTWSELHEKLMQLSVDKIDARLELKRVNPNRLTTYFKVVVVLPLNKLSDADIESDFMTKIGFSLAMPPAIIAEVSKSGPADKASLNAGDQILAIDGHKIIDSLDFIEIINASAGKKLNLLAKQGEQEFETTVTPEEAFIKDKSIGLIKVKLTNAIEMITISNSPSEALIKGVVKTWDTTALNFKMIGRMLTGNVSIKNITGPITIADYAGQTSRMGLISYLSFIALVSISLGVMNLLPIPVLDGGHLLYYSLEVVTGKPVSEKFLEIFQRMGIGALLSLMIIAFFNDIVRLMS